MKALLNRFCWHFVFCLLPLGLFAQQHKFFGVDVEDGLSQNTVWKILQDRTGYLWLATADGIDRYDGYRFEHFDINAQSKGGDGSSILLGLYLDQAGSVWATHKRGLHRYNPNSNQFDHVVVQETGEGEGRSFIFHDDERSIWCIVWKKGLQRFDKKTGALIQQDQDFAFRNQVPISFYGYTQLGPYLYFNNDHGILVRFNLLRQELSQLPIPYLIRNLQPVALGDTALAFLQNDTVCIYQAKTGHWSRQPISGQHPFRPEALISYLPYQGKLWAGSLNGLWVIDPQRWQVEQHIKSFQAGEAETFSYVQSLFVDRDQNLWVGTNGAGLYGMSRQQQRFPHYRHPNPSRNLVKTILADDKGGVYVGAYSHGLFRFQLGSADSPDWLFQGGKLGVITMAWYDENNLLMADQKQAFRYAIDEKRAFPVALPVGCDVFQLAQVPNRPEAVDVLCNAGVYRYQSGQLSLHIPYPNQFASTLHHLSADSLLLGRSDGELLLLQPGLAPKSCFNVHALIKHISRYNDTLFVATVNGLFVLNRAFELLQHFTKDNGLPNNFCYAALRDGRGAYWISHNHGLSRWQPAQQQWQHYSTADGLQSREFNTGAFAEIGDGRLLFGGVNGFNLIDPALVALPLPAPGCVLTGLEINDQALPTDSFYRLHHQLQLPFSANTLSFSFASLHYGQPQGQLYAYRLRGLEEQWIESNERNYIRYANLPPGTYDFEARSRYPGEAWGPAARALHITIAPPYYLQTSFILLSVLFIILLIALVLKAWLGQREQKIRIQLELQQKLEHERQRISRDLHDNVGAQLSFVISNLDWLIDHPLDGPHYIERVKTLSAAGREAMLTLRQTIWAIGQNAISPDDFADRFKTFTQKITQWSEDLQLRFHENFLTLEPLQPTQALHCFRIGQEAIHNSIKHASASLIEVQFSSGPDHLFQLSIRDNGKGFDPAVTHTNGHHGLLNMKQRALECGAELNISSSAKGSCIELLLPAVSHSK